jgi:hypothetical protein
LNFKPSDHRLQPHVRASYGLKSLYTTNSDLKQTGLYFKDPRKSRLLSISSTLRILLIDYVAGIVFGVPPSRSSEPKPKRKAQSLVLVEFKLQVDEKVHLTVKFKHKVIWMLARKITPRFEVFPIPKVASTAGQDTLSLEEYHPLIPVCQGQLLREDPNGMGICRPSSRTTSPAVWFGRLYNQAGPGYECSRSA